jgi:hypothetical protein
MAGLKARVFGIKEGGEWRRLMGGNEGELDAAVFLFRWRRRGDRGGARGRSAAVPCLALVREEEDDGWMGRDGGLGRPGGRGPVGRGGKIGWLEKKRMGRKAGWVES